MNSALRHLCFVAVVLASSQAVQAQPPSTPPTSPGARAAGTATVEGRAEVPNPGGQPQGCAGGEAQLFPAGPVRDVDDAIHLRQRFRGYAPLATGPLSERDRGRLQEHRAPHRLRRRKGAFRFDGVPAGRWYVFTNVVFRAARGDAEPMGAR
jgi:hypothetical protein